MRKVRMGMVGGGKDSFIGAVHRMAAALDGEIELVCGALSHSAEKSRLSGKELYLDEDRIYDSYERLFEREKSLPEDKRMDFVSIVTPNHMHYPVAKLALESGFHVMCDKPVTFNLSEAKELEALVKETGLIFGLTHNYTGYPMVKEARHMVKQGRLGKIRKIVVEYPQGWLAAALESTGQKQADWRTDPERAGISCCMGDIGTHAENLAEYITGLSIAELFADVTTFVDGRKLEDDGNVLLRYEGGAKGVLYASQISVGEENSLRVRVYGELGGLEWNQMEPNTLLAKWLDRPTELIRSGANFSHLSENALHNMRLPAGHPEGFIEAFANLYRNFANALQSKLDGRDLIDLDFPTIEDGVRGMRFIEAVIKSSQSGTWRKLLDET